MIHTLCTILFRNQRTDQGSLDPGSVHFSCMSFAVSCIRRVRSRRDPARPGRRVSPPSWNVQQAGWTASSMGRSPLEVQRACGLVPPIRIGGKDARASLGGPRRARSRLRALSLPSAGRRPGRLGSMAWRQTPCGATRPVSGGRHIGEVHWVGIAERRPLLVGSGRHGRWRCRGQNGSCLRRWQTSSLAAHRGRVTGSRCREMRPKRTPI
jgi:hypothetical protein